MDKINVILSDNTDPRFNLALEDTLFCSHEGENTALFVWFDAPSVIIGKYQNAFAEVNLSRLDDMNIPLIRRETGGGAVYHDLGNMNYAFIAKANGICAADSYDEFLKPIVAALNTLGIPATRDRACDIIAGGKKISGSAQRRARETVLHHGTMLFDTRLDTLGDILSPRMGFSSKAIESFRREVTNVRQFTPYKTADDFARAFIDVLCKNAAITKPALDVCEKARALAAGKYSDWEWNRAVSPKCVYTHDNGEFSFSCEIVRGRLTNITCSLFNEAQNGVSRALDGCRYESADIKTAAQILPDNLKQKIIEALL